jgi:glycosyltransferase involved in cell wall biosynthesis
MVDGVERSTAGVEQILVSVIVPVYNGERFIGEAIDSIRRQRHQALDIIVVDDGSTDGTAEVVRAMGPEVRYVRQANSGPPAARNRGLQLVQGSLIAFLDADDLWTENKLAIQLPLLLSNPSIDIVCGRTQIVLQTGAEGAASLEHYDEPKQALTLQGSLIRRTVFDRVGHLDQSQRFADDVDWFLRAKDLGVSIVSHPEVTWLYRRHDRNITNQVGTHQDYLAILIKKSLDRRRQRDARGAPDVPRRPDY